MVSYSRSEGKELKHGIDPILDRTCHIALNAEKVQDALCMLSVVAIDDDSKAKKEWAAMALIVLFNYVSHYSGASQKYSVKCAKGRNEVPHVNIAQAKRSPSAFSFHVHSLTVLGWDCVRVILRTSEIARDHSLIAPGLQVGSPSPALMFFISYVYHCEQTNSHGLASCNSLSQKD